LLAATRSGSGSMVGLPYDTGCFLFFAPCAYF
jgi:hypothetical protein